MNVLFNECYGIFIFIIVFALLFYPFGVCNKFTNKCVYSIILLSICFILYFYRHKIFEHDDSENIIYSPAYGKIYNIIQTSDKYIISIFLSPFDIHAQYYPTSGTVIERIYDNTGKYKLAFNMNKSQHNEKKIHIMVNKYGTFKITQIAGFLVRRIVSDEQININVKAKQHFGMIKFGSRVDIEIPLKNFVPLISMNDKVHGPETILGYFKSSVKN